MSLLNRKTELGSELKDAGLSDIINSGYATVNIIERLPKQGMPPKGVPFSVKVEVQTFRSASNFRVPFTCLDARIAVRGLFKYNNKILGQSFVRTDALSGCRGTATISFDTEFRPGPDDWVRFEIYPAGVSGLFTSEPTEQEIKSGEAEPIAVSDQMRFNESEETLKKAGLVNTETSSVFNLQNALFKNLQGTVQSVSVLLAVGAGSYLAWQNSDSIKRGIKKLTGK